MKTTDWATLKWTVGIADGLIAAAIAYGGITMDIALLIAAGLPILPLGIATTVLFGRRTP